MISSRSLSRVTVLTLLVAGGALVGSSAAEAAAPASCVRIVSGDTGGVPNGAQVSVTNGCSTTKRVKVVFTHAHDSDCLALARGAKRTVHSNIAYPFSHYDKTVTC